MQMNRMAQALRCQFGLLFALVFLTATGSDAAVTIVLCGNNCLCIDWTTSEGSVVEVRCVAGVGDWVDPPPPPGQLPEDGSGSFSGNGTPQPAPSPLPGNALNASQTGKLNQAKSSATTKLTKPMISEDPPVRSPTTCTELFSNAPLSMTGLQLLNNYAIFRGGEGVAHNGVVKCNSPGTPAWTTCCNHSRVVYLCDDFFQQSTLNASLTLIHELLHLAGQTEDQTNSNGPGNPPTTGQIGDVVHSACSNPTPLY